MTSVGRFVLATITSAGLIGLTGSVHAQETDLDKALKGGGKALAAQELRTLFFGQTHSFESLGGRRGFTYVASGGAFASRSMEPNGRIDRINGSAVINGNTICWMRVGGGNCHTIVRVGDTYRFFFVSDGGVRGTMTNFRPGNPENL